MKKHSNKLVIVLVLLLIASLASLTLWARQTQIVVGRRHHMFCDVLVRGEDRKSVLNTLRQLGEFNYSESSQGEHLVYLIMHYTDPNIVGNKNIGLIFEDEKYMAAYIETGFDGKDFFCSD